jgi:hypothetical protein
MNSSRVDAKLTATQHRGRHPQSSPSLSRARFS